MTTPADDEVTVVWLAPAEGRDDATRALAEWGRARDLEIAPASERSSRGLGVDLAAADRAERELDRSREAIAALDADAAERALARAEAILRDHPELPQAAWLRAEVHRAWSARWMRAPPRDEARAAAAWQEADALDGGRAPGVGEIAAPREAKTAGKVVVRGAEGAEITVRVDGAPIAARASSRGEYPFEAPPAEHAITVHADGALVFAQWVAVAQGASPTVEVRLSAGGACDAASFARIAREDAGVRADGATCDRWVAAIPGEHRGAVLVARCERDRCGRLLEWRTEPLSPSGPPQPLMTTRGAWPAWATWTLVAVGAAAAGTVVLVATGVLEARPTERRFVAGGVRSE